MYGLMRERFLFGREKNVQVVIKLKNTDFFIFFAVVYYFPLLTYDSDLLILGLRQNSRRIIDRGGHQYIVTLVIGVRGAKVK